MNITTFLNLERSLQSRIKRRSTQLAQIEKDLSSMFEMKKKFTCYIQDWIDLIQETKENLADGVAAQKLDKNLLKVYRVIANDVRAHIRSGNDVQFIAVKEPRNYGTKYIEHKLKQGNPHNGLGGNNG